MVDPIHTFNAKTGTIQVYEDKINILRDNLRALMQHGPTDKEIFLENITSINTTPPPVPSLEFEVNGEVQNESGGLFLGQSSENSVHFKGSQTEELNEAKVVIEERVSQANHHGQETTQPPSERLREIEELYEDGLLSEEEYESKRTEILEEL
jgi:uncharacterized protein YqgQ